MCYIPVDRKVVARNVTHMFTFSLRCSPCRHGLYYTYENAPDGRGANEARNEAPTANEPTHTQTHTHAKITQRQTAHTVIHTTHMACHARRTYFVSATGLPRAISKALSTRPTDTPSPVISPKGSHHRRSRPRTVATLVEDEVGKPPKKRKHEYFTRRPGRRGRPKPSEPRLLYSYGFTVTVNLTFILK